MQHLEHNGNDHLISDGQNLKIKQTYNHSDVKRKRKAILSASCMLSFLPLLTSHMIQELSTDPEMRNAPSVDHCKSRTSLRWNLGKKKPSHEHRTHTNKNGPWKGLLNWNFYININYLIDEGKVKVLWLKYSLNMVSLDWWPLLALQSQFLHIL